MINLKLVSILGCGWLGLPLGKHFLASGYKVKGSVRSEENFNKLIQAGIDAYLLDIGSRKIKGNISDFLRNSEILIISLPPRLRKQASESYIDKMNIILPFIEQSDINKVLFISSTSVYANDNSIVTEDAFPFPETESGRQLLTTELILKNNTHFQTTILRFGGLIGPDRHPVTSLAGKKNLKDPEAPVNLIHLNDCLNIISSIIEQEKWNEVFNAVAPFHPTREIYYTEMAKLKGLIPPIFNKHLPSKGKTVSILKLQNMLQYQFSQNYL